MVTWFDKAADKLIHNNPDLKEYVLAAGTSPSGTIHIGNFRDVITPEAVARSLRKKGKNARVLFSWDDYDRFRKVPKNVPKEYEQYLGMPYTKVPDPHGQEDSYATYYEKEYEKEIPKLGIKLDYKYQTKIYESGAYNELIVEAMTKRKQIAEILSGFKKENMKPEQIKNYYPLTIYCEKCSKDDTKITNYKDDKTEVTYECKCGHTHTADISKKCIGKLVWKVDWAMRWKYENVVFEPGGRDHSTPGGSYDVSSKICRDIYNHEPPIYQPYDFIGIRGSTSKMSGSTGINISPKEILSIYEPELLLWLFVRIRPEKQFSFAFDSEIIRQYDEFDRQIRKYLTGKLNDDQKSEMDATHVEGTKFLDDNISFRQISSIGQISQGNLKETYKILDSLGLKYNKESVARRLPLSQNWVNKYAPDMKVTLRTTANTEYYNKLNKTEKEQVNKFFKEVEKHWTPDGLKNFIYSIAKDNKLTDEENKTLQRDFFKHIYYLLVDKETGPRLPTLLIAIGKDKIKQLTV